MPLPAEAEVQELVLGLTFLLDRSGNLLSLTQLTPNRSTTCLSSTRLHNTTTGNSSSMGGMTGPTWTTATSQQLYFRLRTHLTTSDHELTWPMATPRPRSCSPPRSSSVSPRSHDFIFCTRSRKTNNMKIGCKLLYLDFENAAQISGICFKR